MTTSPVWLITLAFFAALSPIRSGTVQFEVHHPAASNADIRIALYDSKTTWLEEPAHTAIAAATDTLTIVRFADVPAGIFGAAVYLDENRNGKLDRNLVGWFKEPFGFSREARVRLGPHKWDDAIFEVNDEEIVLEVTLD